MMANRCHWSVARQRQIEQGLASPTLSTQRRLARALGIGLPDLMDYEESPAMVLPRLVITAKRDGLVAARRQHIAKRDAILEAHREKLAHRNKMVQAMLSSRGRTPAVPERDSFAASDQDAGSHVYGEPCSLGEVHP